MQQKPVELLPRESAAEPLEDGAWYKNVSGYQWLILVIASAGWIFDVYEGQIFNITRNQLLSSVLHVPGNDPLIQRYGDVSLAWFLLGGTAGGLLFGSLADRWGRKPTMALTILTYSIFSGLTFFAQAYWQVAALRFLVAMGVGGEWAVAASLVAEVFPARARAHASGIFHATSVLGTYAATFAGLAVGAHWRNAYLIGIVPALLVAGVMIWVKEPESWKRAGEKVKSAGGEMGSLRDLLGHSVWRKRAILGMLLAAVGLGSFWAISVAGQDLAKAMLLRTGTPLAEAIERSKSAYGYIQTAGGGLGLLAFGPLCVRLGRRRTFSWMLIGAFLIVPITCYLPRTYGQLLALLPMFGFLTLGIHAGFAIYFPELFPTHLRATGAGFCFNVGRTVAASVLYGSGQLKSLPGMELRTALCLLSVLFLLGVVIVRFLPETKGQALPE
jgi:MFS family permease